MPAGRAELRPAAALLFMPFMPAFAAPELSLTTLELIVSPGHPNRHAVDERFGHPAPGALCDAPKSGARHPHSLSSVFMT
jgi:hypothetical protein